MEEIKQIILKKGGKYMNNEIYKVDGGLFVSLNTDVLDAGHPYIAIQMEGEF